MNLAMRKELNMRDVILHLESIFDTAHRQRISQFVNTMYQRVLIYRDYEFTLHDVDSSVVIKRLNAFLETTQISCTSLTKYVKIVPTISLDKQSFDCVIDVLPGFFTQLMKNKNTVINHYNIVHQNDTFERTGPFEAPKHVLCTSERGDVYHAYLTGTYNGEVFSTFLEREAIDEVKKNVINNRFFGINPYTDDEWNDVIICALFHRLIKEDSFSRAWFNLAKRKQDTLLSLANSDITSFEVKQDSGVYDNYGFRIGKKLVPFDVIDAKKEKIEAATNLKLVASNSDIKRPSGIVKTGGDKVAENEQGFVVVDEWGNF